jgi:hypothetical protein
VFGQRFLIQEVKMVDPRQNCIHRLLGECGGCVQDLDLDHHPNNLDCPRYQAVGIVFLSLVRFGQTPNRGKEVPMTLVSSSLTKGR